MTHAQERRPLLFLDVDGVLNCVERDEWGQLAEYEPGRRFPVYPPPGTAERVRRLLAVFDPVWATAWRGSAHRCWAPVLGIDATPWPFVDYREFKLPALLNHAGRRPWAWVDDDAMWELRETGITPTGLVVAPSHEEGLTDEHVERLLAWAATEAGA